MNKLIEDLKDKSEQELEGIFKEEMRKLIERGATGISISLGEDINLDKSKFYSNMIIFMSYMNKEMSRKIEESEEWDGSEGA